MKIKIRKADSCFSNYIRTRDKWTCQRCFKQHEEHSQGLHNAHMHTRRNESTRFDPENCCALCYGCHQFVDSHPFEKIEFFTKRLGQDKFDALRVRTNTFQKKDDEIVILWCKKAMETL